MADSFDGNVLAAMSLARFGVTHMFGVVGIPVTSLANRAVQLGIRFIAFHNEQSAGYAASVYGYLTVRPGLLLTVSGPGCVHGRAGLSNAMVNTWPMVMISGSSDQKDSGRGDFQELDQIEAVKPFSKFSVKAKDIKEIPNCVARVLDHAVSGRPGGCYLDLPTDVLHQKITEAEAEILLIEAEKGRIFREPMVPPSSEIEKAVSMLRKAERPLIVFGKGAAYGRAEGELRKLVERTGIPFLPTPMGKGLANDDHELAASAARSLAIGKCDVALVVGARLNWLLHFGESPKWDKDVKFILVDVCEEEIKLRKPHLGLVGEARKVLEMINKEIKDDPFCLGKSNPWVEAISKKVKDNVSRVEAQLVKDVVPFNFLTPMRIIRDAILGLGSPAPVVVSEGANTMDVGRSVLVQTEPRTRLDAGTWGTMGVGLGYCIAAAVANPDRLVVAVEGDSGFGFSAMEVEAIFPRIFGHEASGIVESVGKGVTEFVEGDHVLTVFTGECKTCKHCISGKSNMCQVLGLERRGVMHSDQSTRFSVKGKPVYHYCAVSSFSEFTVVHSGCAVKVSPHAPLEKICLLSCGVAAGLGAAWNIADISKGSTVVIFGLGTVGLAVAQGAKLRGASQIIGVEINPEKYEKAKAFGVTDFLNPNDCNEPIHQVIKRISCGGTDFSFECIGDTGMVATALQSCCDGWGLTVTLGVPKTKPEISSHYSAFLSGKTLKGSLFGGWKPKSDLPSLVQKYMNEEIQIDEFVTHNLPFEDINKAFNLMREGKCLRCVIHMPK